MAAGERRYVTQTVLFAANRGYALTSAREALILRFLESGWKVVIATADDEESQHLAELGAWLEPVDFDRGGLSAVSDIRAYRRMVAIHRSWQPTLSHHFHAKPAVLGSIAARSTTGDGVRVINTITGLGHAFTAGGLTALLASGAYRTVLPRSDIVVFQNSDDRSLFLKHGWVTRERARLIIGSGVDLERYSFIDRTGNNRSAPVVVMLGRLLRQKGIPEFIDVSRRLRARWPLARFVLAGEEDVGHPDAVTAAWIREQKSVEYVGRMSDVRPLLEEADLLLFPSYYREGVPRVVMEAAAAGLPTVAYDVPGVREAVRHRETGYLVPSRDVDALVTRVTELLEDENQRLVLGRAARRLAEEAFDIRSIQEQYLSLYKELGADI